MSEEEANTPMSIASAESVGQPITNSTPGTTNNAENNTTPSSEQPSRRDNFQRIQQRKQQISNLPQEQKFLKLAQYSQCQGQDCKCRGWKSIQGNEAQTMATFGKPCQICPHTMENHVSHLRSFSEEKINNLLGMVVDVDNLFVGMHREEDPDTKRVYYYLFKLLRKSILTTDKPLMEGPLGQPPFEEPCISKAITNFVVYKFAHLGLQEWQSMYDVAKMFLYFLNQWNYLNPSARTAIVGPDEVDTYKVNYTRWLVFCHVPVYCDSLPLFYTTSVFGRTMLRAVFKPMCKQLTDKCHTQEDKMPAEKRILVLNYLPKFLSMLEAEIYAEGSPIWDPEYKQVLLEDAADDVYRLVNEFEKVTVISDDEDNFTRST